MAVGHLRQADADHVIYPFMGRKSVAKVVETQVLCRLSNLLSACPQLLLSPTKRRAGSKLVHKRQTNMSWLRLSTVGLVGAISQEQHLAWLRALVAS